MEVATEVTIDASRETVWRILTDVQCYPQWNPYICELHGKLAVAEPIEFRFALFWGITLPAQAHVLAAVAGHELRWAGHLLWDWLFRAEHYHIIEPLSDGAVRFAHGERFSGVLTMVLVPFLRIWAPGRYHAVNLALKQRAERAQHGEAPS